MEIDNKKIFFGMAVIALFLISVIVSQSYNAERNANEQKIRLTEIGRLQFKGRVINSKVYRYFGKNYYMVCVKIDSANVKNLYIFNNLDCIKIKNGIATFAAGYLNHILGVVDSVAVNINNSGKIIFHYKGNARDELPLGFDPKGLKESDLNACN
jgi:hypothetical protein